MDLFIPFHTIFLEVYTLYTDMAELLSAAEHTTVWETAC